MGGWIMGISGFLVMLVATAGRARRLPRNHFVGIRLPSTMRSDRAWMEAHQASWPFTFAAGLIIAVAGPLVGLDGDEASPLMPLVIGATLLALVAGAIRAHQAARSVPPPDRNP